MTSSKCAPARRGPTDNEAQLLAVQLTKPLPGHPDILGVLVFLFVLLLVTDILACEKSSPSPARSPLINAPLCQTGAISCLPPCRCRFAVCCRPRRKAMPCSSLSGQAPPLGANRLAHRAARA